MKASARQIMVGWAVWGVLAGWAVAERAPNILLIYLDDMGWAQPGCYGGKLAPTPHVDRLAAEGVRFTNGYVSACVCSPSRVGLMTGRYQARTGHDANSAGSEPQQTGRELLLTETVLAQPLQAAGYETGIFGKWHLGATTPDFLPVKRGFAESFGTATNLGERGNNFYRGERLVADPAGAPVTSPIFAREAVDFIRRHRDRPWFLYLPLNAVHSPLVASEAVLARFGHLEGRDKLYAGLIAEADDAIGQVLGCLAELGLEEETLIFCVSDNGGSAPQAEMGGLRGRKWLVWEGGIRVPFVVHWKGRIAGGRVSDEPVIQLDIFPTALAAAGVAARPEWKLDGVNLLPLLEGKVDRLEPRALYWRFGVQYAVREGDWKLVKPGLEEPVWLVNLAEDPGEQKDRTAEFPGKAKELQKRWDEWNAGNRPPRWEDRRWNDGNQNPRQRRQQQAGE